MQNQRQYPRYEIKIDARVYTEDLSLPVHVVDISEEGIGVILEKPIKIGSKISISLFPLIEEPIIGTPMWSFFSEEGQKHYYKMGIETENLALDRMKVLGFPIKPGFINR